MKGRDRRRRGPGHGAAGRGGRSRRLLLAVLAPLVLGGAGAGPPVSGPGEGAGPPGAGRRPPQTSAREIVDRVDRILRGRSSHGLVAMEVVTRRWTRRLELEVWSLGTEYALVRVLSPGKEAGTATLKAGEQIWNYLPRVDRTIKIPPSLMLGSWMGSHFTNDDLVKESRMVEDYEIAVSFEGHRRGEEIWEFTLTPREEAAVVWGRVVLEVRKRDLMPLRALYYDEEGRLARTVEFGEYRVLGGRLVPGRMTVTPADEPEEHTTLVYRELEFDVPLDPSFFSLRNLRSLRR